MTTASILTDEQLRTDVATLVNFVVTHRRQTTSEETDATAEAANRTPRAQSKQATHDNNNNNNAASVSRVIELNDDEENCDGSAQESFIIQNNTEADRTASAASATAIFGNSARTALGPLQEELKETTAQLHAERAALAQLRLQQRCDAATIQELAQHLEDEKQRHQNAETVLADSFRKENDALMEKYTTLANQYHVVEGQMQACQRVQHACESEAHRLRELLNELKRTNQALTGKVNVLLSKLADATRESHRLAKVDVELRTTQLRLREAEAQHDEKLAQLCALQESFNTTEKEMKAAVRLFDAMQQEHAETLAALSQQRSACVRWEKLFKEEKCSRPSSEPEFEGATSSTTSVGAEKEDKPPELSVAATKLHDAENSSPHPDTTALAASKVPTSDVRANRNEESSPRKSCGSLEDEVICTPDPHASRQRVPQQAVLAQQLEAKVADLAIQLYDAQSRATLAESTADALARLHVTNLAASMELSAMLCVLRPAAASLAEANADLTARLAVEQNAVEPLMQHVVTLMELLTEECARRGLLQQQLHLMQTKQHQQQQQQRHEVSATPAVGGEGNLSTAPETPSTTLAEQTRQQQRVPGKRHRLNPSALFPHRHQQK